MVFVGDEHGEHLKNMRTERVGNCAECGRETDRFIPPFNGWWCLECQQKRHRPSGLVFHRPG